MSFNYGSVSLYCNVHWSDCSLPGLMQLISSARTQSLRISEPDQWRFMCRPTGLSSDLSHHSPCTEWCMLRESDIGLPHCWPLSASNGESRNIFYEGTPARQCFSAHDRTTVHPKTMTIRWGLKFNGGIRIMEVPEKCHIQKIMTLSEAREEKAHSAGLESQTCTEPQRFWASVRNEGTANNLNINR